MTKPIALLFFTITVTASSQVMDFKGLRLGMTMQQVDSIVAANNWHYSIAFGDSERQWVDPMLMNPAFKTVLIEMPNASMGCIAIGAKEFCAVHEDVHLDFHKGIVRQISTSSEEGVTARPDSVRGWAQVAISFITKKIGAPTTTLIDLNKANLTKALLKEPYSSVKTNEWTNNSLHQKVTVYFFSMPKIGKQPPRTDAWIRISDTKVDAELEAERLSRIGEK